MIRPPGGRFAAEYRYGTRDGNGGCSPAGFVQVTTATPRNARPDHPSCMTRRARISRSTSPNRMSPPPMSRTSCGCGGVRSGAGPAAPGTGGRAVAAGEPASAEPAAGEPATGGPPPCSCLGANMILRAPTSKASPAMIATMAITQMLGPSPALAATTNVHRPGNNRRSPTATLAATRHPVAAPRTGAPRCTSFGRESWGITWPGSRLRSRSSAHRSQKFAAMLSYETRTPPRR